MDCPCRALWVVVLLTTAIAASAGAEQTYLEATFNDKTIDAPIGIGGAALGEPVGIDYGCSATVRSTPFDTPCLEIAQAVYPYFGEVDFELLNSIEPVSGMVVMVLDLWFEEVAAYHEYAVRTFTGGGQNFFTMEFLDGGIVRVWCDGTGTETIGAVPLGRVFPVLVAFNMDSRTYSVWLDGAAAATDQPLGIAPGGLAHIWIGPYLFPVAGSRMWLDQIRVIDWLPEVPVRDTTWGTVRALYR